MRRLFRFLLLFVFLINTAFYSRAQFNQQALENRIRPDSLKTGELEFNFYNFNYVRNYEYFNAFQDGYTLYGTQIEPQFVYFAHPNLAVKAGAYLRKDFGGKALHTAKPLFSINYSKKNLSLIFGALEGNIQHRYVEPLLDFESKIVDPVEYGTQLLINNNWLFLDAYISWDKMIYKGDAQKEQISGGLSSEIALYNTEKLKLTLPVQFLVRHRGGQIDMGANEPLSTRFNGAVGFKIEKLFPYSKNFKRVFTENYLNVFKDFSPIKQLPFNSGNGVWLNGGVESRFGTFVTSYWKGSNFYSIRGMPIFQSLSQEIHNKGYVEKERALLFFRYAYQHQLIPNLYLDVRLEPVIDLKSPLSKKMDLSNSFFLTYKESFSIGKIKK